jgi:hypothetical protein
MCGSQKKKRTMSAWDVDELIGTLLHARTPRAFTGAFNAVLQRACPRRAIRLLVMTHDAYRNFPDLGQCTFDMATPWHNRALYASETVEEDVDHDSADDVAIGFYLLEGTACAASIELRVDGTSAYSPEGGHVGSIYARTHSARQKLDMYSLVMAATVLYTALFPFPFPDDSFPPAKLDRLHSEAVVVPSMWVLRPYKWVFPGPRDFDKDANDSYAAYDEYYRSVHTVHIYFRPSANVAAAGEVLRDLCVKSKFCHSRERLDAAAPKAALKTKSTHLVLRFTRRFAPKSMRPSALNTATKGSGSKAKAEYAARLAALKRAKSNALSGARLAGGAHVHRSSRKPSVRRPSRKSSVRRAVSMTRRRASGRVRAY